jgi:uncharacterized protein YozE (UPF0346 family)
MHYNAYEYVINLRNPNVNSDVTFTVNKVLF